MISARSPIAWPRRPVGGTAKLGIVRDSKRYTATVALVAAPETVPRDERLIAGDSPFAGLTVLNLSPAVAEEFSYRGELGGRHRRRGGGGLQRGPRRLRPGRRHRRGQPGRDHVDRAAGHRRRRAEPRGGTWWSGAAAGPMQLSFRG